MPDDNQIADNSKKIDNIYQIIEFEIDFANNQISLFKKDNINFILLFLALIGFFAFIPIDVFFYQWFPNGILITITTMGCIGSLSIWALYNLPSWDKTVKQNNEDKTCDSCDSSTICKNITDPIIKEKIQKYTDSVLIDNLSLVYSALMFTSCFFFLSCLISYLNLTNSNPSKEIVSLFPQNSWIICLLVLTLLVYILLYIKHSRLVKEGDLKKYLSQLAVISILIVLLTGGIYFYGNYSKIPPFVPIENSSQFSPLLIEHSKIIPEFPLSLVVTLYTAIIALILLEYLLSSQYIEKINQKLNGLFDLKYRIDRFQLGISPEPNIEDILKKLSRLKIHPPDFYTFGGILTIPVPLEFNQCEETIYLALENTRLEVEETSQE